MSRQMMALKPTGYSQKHPFTLSRHAVSLRLCYQILVKKLIPSLIVSIVTLRRSACRHRPRLAFLRDHPGGVLQCRIVSNNMGHYVGLFEPWLRCMNCSTWTRTTYGTYMSTYEDYVEDLKGHHNQIAKAGANVVIHHSDKTKVMGQLNESFVENTPTKMRSCCCG